MGIALATVSSFVGASSSLSIKRGHLEKDRGRLGWGTFYVSLGLFGMIVGVPVCSVSALM